MSGIGLNIQSDELADLITVVETFGDRITGDDIRHTIGDAAFEVVKAHFEKLANDEAHHKSALALGAAPTGFYERASKSVQQPQLEGDGVSISIDQQGLAQRLFGGTIEAKPGGFLTIPARTETYGKRAGEFSNLRLIIFGHGDTGALVERDASVLRGGKRGKRGGLAGSLAGKRKGGEIGGGIYFWLVKSVTQPADPDVLPTDEEILDPAIQNARRYISRIWDERLAA